MHWQHQHSDAEDHGARAETKTASSSGKTFRESHDRPPELAGIDIGSVIGEGEGGVGSSMGSAWASAQSGTIVRSNKKHKVLLPGEDKMQHESGGPDPANVWAAMEQAHPSPLSVCVGPL
jgi:hypothetical protein